MRKFLSKKLLPVILALCMTTTSFSGNGLSVKVFAKGTGESESTLLNDSTEAEKYATGGFTEEEFQEIIENSKKAENSIPASSSINAADLPSKVDNSKGENGKYFPPIGNQEGIGSCSRWVHGYYMMTYMFNRYYNRKVDETNTYSPKWLYANDTTFTDYNGNYTWSGSLTLDRCPITNFSKATEDGTDFPADCEADWMAAQLTKTTMNALINAIEQEIEGKSAVIVDDGPDSKQLQVVKQCLADGQVLYLSTFAYWFNYDQINGNLSAANKEYANQQIVVACAGQKGSNMGGHAMTIVGYDDNIGVDLNGNGKLEKGEKGAFKVANSWGATWGNEGYVWIAYDALNTVSQYSKIGTGSNEQRKSVSAQIYEMKWDTEQMKKEELDYYAVITLNTDNRYLTIQSCKDSGSIVDWLSYYPTNYNFSGSTGYADATIVMKCSNFNEDTEDYLRISGGDLTIKDIKFVDNVNHITYAAKSGKSVLKSGERTTWYIDKSNVAPNFTKYTLSEKDGVVTANVTATDKAGGMKYELSYKSEDGNDSGTLNSNTTGSFSFTAKSVGYYRVKVTATDANNKSTTKTKLIKVNDDFRIYSFTPSIASEKVTATQNVTFTAGANRAENLQYQFLVDGTVKREYAQSSSFTWNAEHSYYGHKIKVNVKDTSTGEVVSKEISYIVNKAPVISGYTINPATPYAGETVKIMLSGMYGTGALTRKVEVQPAGGTKSVIFNGGTSTQITWTPKTAGNYKIYYTITDANKVSVSRSADYVVKQPENSINVYYANSSFTNAYIHYRVGNGSWTSVPGVKMSTSSEQSGYTWKYTIDLGSASNATVCFNNGSNSWDSKNGANYTLKAGTFGIKNQNVEELAKEVVKEFSISSFTTSSSVGGTNVQMYLDTEVVNGTAPYTYQYSYVLNGASTSLANGSTKKISWTPYKAGTYTLKVKVTDAQGKTAEKQISNYVVEGPKVSSFTASLSSPQKVGTKITLEGIVKNVQEDNYNSYAYSVTKDGKTTQLKTSNRKAVWTPTEAGVYTLNFKFTDYLGSTVLNKTMTYTINDTSSSSVTVYYANSSWSQAYIHYRVGNGSWTTAPGVKMSTSSEQSGYTWKYTIDLGSASNATVCFNNGSNSWDSKNGANYTVYAGNYGIKNSQVTKLSGTSSTTTPTTPPTTPPSTTPPSPTPTPELKITLEADKASPIKVGTAVKFIGNSTNENYHRYNSHIFSVVKQGGSSNTDSSRIPGTAEGEKGYSYTWTPTEAGTYTIGYETIEYSGRSAKKTMTFVVTATQTNVVNVYYYNSSWSQAYIHYRVGNGSWTSAPGVKMSTSSEQSGYTWKYTIDLGSASNATVCFNNGNNSWDSKNGANYTVYAGNYGVKNSQVTKLSGTSSTTTPTTPPTTPPSTTPPSPTPTPELKVTLEADKASPIKVGTAVKFIGNSTNENYHRYNSHIFSVVKQGGSSNTDSSRIPGTAEGEKGYSYTWTPTEAGTYTIGYETIEYSGRSAKKTMTFVVTATQANVVNVYYYNSSWSQAYIHYKVGNGSWTSVPGQKMSTSSEQSGYTWKYTIDLGSASNATICFNNGNNSWDSRNGGNYTVYAGNYGVKNQQAVKLSSAVNNAPENNTSTASLDSTVSDMTVVKSIRTVYQLLANLNKMNVSEN